MDETLQKYLVYFKKIKRCYNKGFGKAPHKPLLLLSIIQLAENALLRNNRLFISSDIILAFRDYFKALVKTGHINNFVLPFYHMGSEPFYRLIPKIGMAQELQRAKSIKNLNKLMDLISHAEIDYVECRHLECLINVSQRHFVLIDLLMKLVENTVWFFW